MWRGEVERLCGQATPQEQLPEYIRSPNCLSYSWGEVLLDKRGLVIWVHGDQLERNGHRNISNGMTRDQVIDMGMPTNPLERVGATSTETNYYPRGVSVSFVNRRLMFSTVKCKASFSP